MKGLIILLFFLASGCPISKVKTKTIVKQKETETVYETPPHAPIPPENYCYELHQGANGQDITRLKLTITLDSVLGKINHIPLRQDEPDGEFIGTLYNNILLVSFQYSVNGKTQSENQEWKISNDSIYRKIMETVKQDSSHVGMKDSVRVFFAPALHKAPCI